MKTKTMCHNDSINTELEEAEISISDEYPFVQGIIPGTMSGAEMLACWKDSGCFEVWAEQYTDIAPGKKYADSTKYVQAMRAKADYRGHSCSLPVYAFWTRMC